MMDARYLLKNSLFLLLLLSVPIQSSCTDLSCETDEDCAEKIECYHGSSIDQHPTCVDSRCTCDCWERDQEGNLIKCMYM
jgi:hypothetical protein